MLVSHKIIIQRRNNVFIVIIVIYIYVYAHIFLYIGNKTFLNKFVIREQSWQSANWRFYLSLTHCFLFQINIEHAITANSRHVRRLCGIYQRRRKYGSR